MYRTVYCCPRGVLTKGVTLCRGVSHVHIHSILFRLFFSYKGPDNIEDKVFSEDTVTDQKDTLIQLVESDRLSDEKSVSGSANPRSLSQTTPKKSTPRSREKGKDSRPRSHLNRHEMYKPINRRGSHIRIGLTNRSLWELFDTYSTEMLVNRRGR